MIDFIFTNYEILAMMLAAIIALLYAVYTRQWELLRSAALSLMLNAERILVTTEGKKKMDWVYVQSWQRLPRWLKSFVSEKTLREKLQEWYNWAKNQME